MNCRSRWKVLLLTLAAVAVWVTATPPLVAQQGSGTIRGRVLDANSGRPTPTAQVFVPGTGRGALSNPNGDFLIQNVTPGERIVRVELIGYSSQQQTVMVTAGGTAVVDFRLAVSAIGLDELVVTGVPGGTQKRAIGNVVTQVRAADVIEAGPINNIMDMLNARTPGLIMMPQTGQVGGSGKIRIRGASSMNLNNEPLVYVDGIRTDNTNFSGMSRSWRANDFRPEDIESIEIIKGPAASTLYGTEAANGVIQIITKKGRIGTPVFGMTARVGNLQFANLEERMYTNYWKNTKTGQVDSINLATLERERFENGELDSEGNLIQPLFRTGYLQNYGLNVTGGTDAFRYYLATGYDHETGIERRNYMKRFSTKVNVTVFPKEGWDITASTGWIESNQSGATEGSGGGRTWGSYFSTPANLNENIAVGSPPRRGYRSNTAEGYDNYDDYDDLKRFTGSVIVNHRPTEWLSQRLTLGIDAVLQHNEWWQEKNALYLRFSPTGLGNAGSSRSDRKFTTMDYSLTAKQDWTDAWSSETSAGLQYYNRKNVSASATGTDFALAGLTAVSATATRNSSGTWSEETSVGVFVQQQVNWNGRVFLTGAVRADDHSAFGEDFDLVYYPKASATWVLSEEEFFSVPGVSSFRLRGAWGASGQQPSAFAALRTFGSTIGPLDKATVTPSTPGNPKLGPQKASEMELGFDAGLFDERMSVELTYYDTRVTDDILTQGAPPSQGFPGTQYLNIGKSKKWGFEALLVGTVFSTEKAMLESSLSMSMNDSEVQYLGGDSAIVQSSSWGVEHRIGYPLGSWFHVKVVDAQLDAAGKPIRTSMMCATPDGGQVACFTGNTITAPRVHLGRTIPKWEGAFSSTLTLFDNISVYGMLDFKLGGMKWDHNLRIRCSLYYICRENQYPLEYNPVDIAMYANSASFGAAYIKGASFARLREVSVSYSLPTELASRFRASRASISLAGRNLMTFTGYKGMEVEAMFSGSSYVMQEQNQIPQLRQFSFTTNLTF
ncbi:MAG: SusC/RagA family TonB-linked outer membrane protein [Longimicrobiales bacterium]